MREDCNGCVWLDECSGGIGGGCCHFDSGDEEINEYIERKRDEFYIDWIEYIGVDAYSCI